MQKNKTLKKTVYFVSEQHSANNLHLAIKDVETKRDAFIKENLNTIGRIENENIQVVRPSQYNGSLQVIMTLTYYLENEA